MFCARSKSAAATGRLCSSEPAVARCLHDERFVRPSGLRNLAPISHALAKSELCKVNEFESALVQGVCSGRGWDRTSDPSRVKRVLSR